MGRKIDKLKGLGSTKVSWVKTISIGLSGILISYIVFLMVEVVWADLIRNILTTAYEGSIYTTSLLVLMVGIGISILISIAIFAILLKTKRLKVKKLTIFWIIVIVSILTFITILFISFFTIEMQYPEVFGEYTMASKLMLFPQYIAYYAIYALDSPVVMWDITAVIFGIYIIIVIKLRIKEYKPKRRVKPLYGRSL